MIVLSCYRFIVLYDIVELFIIYVEYIRQICTKEVLYIKYQKSVIYRKYFYIAAFVSVFMYVRLIRLNCNKFCIVQW